MTIYAAKDGKVFSVEADKMPTGYKVRSRPLLFDCRMMVRQYEAEESFEESRDRGIKDAQQQIASLQQRIAKIREQIYSLQSQTEAEPAE